MIRGALFKLQTRAPASVLPPLPCEVQYSVITCIYAGRLSAERACQGRLMKVAAAAIKAFLNIKALSIVL